MRVPVPDTILPADQLGKVHFVGIGGAGLSAIAHIMLARGIVVSGSDGADSPRLAALAAQGARVHVGHAAEQLGDADTLVVSTAVREDNPEVVEALARGLRVLPRSAGLAAVMADRRVVAVAGTHGKTTTTGLLTSALVAAGADPSYAVGGVLTQTGTNAHDGTGDLFVAEADESDGAFLVYRPSVAVVTNVDADHLDVWGSEEAYRGAFSDFLDRIEPGGHLVASADDEGARALLEQARERGLHAHAVGESDDATWRVGDVVLEGTTSTFTLTGPSAQVGPVALRVPGRHYVLDAALALVAGLLLDQDGEALRSGLEAFTGTGRRMEPKGEVGGVRVYDSYAHHPSEIVGDLQAARSVAGSGRLVVAFQPHLVSRTRIFASAMGVALGAADEVVVADVYLAREDPDPAVTGALVAEAVPLPGDRVAFVPALDDVAAELVRRARPGDLVVTLGAGSITDVGPRVLALLAEADPQR